MTLQIINHFKFDDGEIFEVKFCKLTSRSTKQSQYQWYLIYNDERYDLHFDKFENNIRYLFNQIGPANFFSIELYIDNLSMVMKKYYHMQDYRCQEFSLIKL